MAADAGAYRDAARATCNAGELDVIVLGTATPDRLLPATAVDLQAALGATRAAAFDVSAACSGLLYGLQVAEGLIAAGVAETVARRRRREDERDRRLEGSLDVRAVRRRRRAPRCSSGPSSGKGILSSFMRSDGTLAELLYRPAGGATVPFTDAGAQRPQPLREDGRPRGVQARRALDVRGRRSRARRRAAHGQRHRPA